MLILRILISKWKAWAKENLLEHLRRELNILQMHNKWNQIVLTVDFNFSFIIKMNAMVDYFILKKRIDAVVH